MSNPFWECSDAKTPNQRMNFRIGDERFAVSQDAALVSSCIFHLNDTIMELINSLNYTEEEIENGER